MCLLQYSIYKFRKNYFCCYNNYVTGIPVNCPFNNYRLLALINCVSAYYHYVGHLARKNVFYKPVKLTLVHSTVRVHCALEAVDWELRTRNNLLKKKFYAHYFHLKHLSTLERKGKLLKSCVKIFGSLYCSKNFNFNWHNACTQNKLNNK